MNAKLHKENKGNAKDPRPTGISYMEEIQRRADTVTPLLKGILDYRPRPQWNPPKAGAPAPN